MAVKLISTILGRNDQLLYEVKKGIRAEGEKQVAKVMEKLPSPQQLQAQFNEKPIFSQEEFNKVEKNYIKTKSFLIKSKTQLEDSKNSLLKLKAKTQKVEGTITKIQGIFDKLTPLIKVLSATVITVKILISGIGSIPMTTTLPVPAPFGLIPPLPAPSGVVPPGPLIKANDTAKIAAGKILAFSALIIAITSSFPYYLNLIRENLNILDKALEALDKLIAQIDQLIQLLEQLYLQLLKNMQLTNPSDSGINPLDSASTPEDLYAQLPNLEGLGDLPHQPNPNPEPGTIKDKEFIEYTKEEDGKKRGYRRYKK